MPMCASPSTAESAFKNVIEVKHPLVQHHLATLRAVETSPEQFRSAGKRITRVLMTVASEALPLAAKTITTPMCEMTANVVPDEHEIFLCPILRAGLVMTDEALELMPMASVYHIGLKRDEETLEAITYYERLPESFDPAKISVLILDPMLATGGSALSAIQILEKRGIPQDKIRLVSLIASPEGLVYLETHAPAVKIITASVDDGLNEKAYILPGLGDAGDRTFNTP